jgi:hypothetical protein
LEEEALRKEWYPDDCIYGGQTKTYDLIIDELESDGSDHNCKYLISLLTNKFNRFWGKCGHRKTMWRYNPSLDTNFENVMCMVFFDSDVDFAHDAVYVQDLSCCTNLQVSSISSVEIESDYELDKCFVKAPEIIRLRAKSSCGEHCRYMMPFCSFCIWKVPTILDGKIVRLYSAKDNVEERNYKFEFDTIDTDFYARLCSYEIKEETYNSIVELSCKDEEFKKKLCCLEKRNDKYKANVRKTFETLSIMHSFKCKLLDDRNDFDENFWGVLYVENGSKKGEEFYLRHTEAKSVNEIIPFFNDCEYTIGSNWFVEEEISNITNWQLLQRSATDPNHFYYSRKSAKDSVRSNRIAFPLDEAVSSEHCTISLKKGKVLLKFDSSIPYSVLVFDKRDNLVEEMNSTTENYVVLEHKYKIVLRKVNCGLSVVLRLKLMKSVVSATNRK